MREPFWASECLRFYGLVVLVSLGSRAVIAVSGETGLGRWVVRVAVLCAVASALGYV